MARIVTTLYSFCPNQLTPLGTPDDMGFIRGCTPGRQQVLTFGNLGVQQVTSCVPLG